MATNDGYSPYPIGLTAAEAVAAIKRAHNLYIELSVYNGFRQSATPPAILTIKNGDLWFNTTTEILYRANIDGTTLLWFEV